ncbi:MAG: phage late control D family protein [Beijerinckiaceae bacterium]
MSFRRSFYKIIVAGQDVTSRFDPLLLDVSVTDNIGSTSDTCEIELADPGGMIKFPGKGDPILVFMGVDDAGAGEVFRGTVDEVRSRGSKQNGRIMRISGKGIDTTKKVKEPQQKHKDDASFGDVAQEWGQAAGVQVTVHGDLASIQRKYWDMRGESFIHWGKRVADEIGASFKVSGDRAVFVPANDGETASGQGAPSLSVVFGQNLLEWDIAPVIGRPAYKTTEVRWYDREAGQWKTEKVETKNEGVDASARFKFTDANQDQAKKKAESEGKKSEREGAEGTVEIVGDPTAKAGGKCIVVGVRPGIDGEYRIKSATHRLQKSSGYTTSLSLDQAQGEAGKDGRSATGNSQP